MRTAKHFRVNMGAGVQRADEQNHRDRLKTGLWGKQDGQEVDSGVPEEDGGLRTEETVDRTGADR